MSVLLHGVLRIHVKGAEDLPDTDTAFFNIDYKDVTDPYACGYLGEARLFRTRYIGNDLNPVWDEKFTIQVCHPADDFTIHVKDKEHIGATYIASAVIGIEDVASGDPVEGWFDLMNGEKPKGRIELSVHYTPKEAMEEACGKDVLDTYFPVRPNCRMTLYQDADTPPLPQFESVTFPDGSPYVPTRCWVDLYDAIRGAEKFVYITGWSVYTEICLVRGEEDPDGLSNVGELLKRKADEGVKVLMMVWNEMTSNDAFPGMMGTHDEETRRYFSGTDVECVLVPRQKNEGMLADKFVGTCYTHHQKTVICDAEDPGSGLRRVLAFIGGLDITSGRYDTPEFPLFKTIKTLHAGDFYSNCVPGATEAAGPREPWHDCHARVDGPVALDIMRNFEERWSKQGGDDDAGKLYYVDPDEFDVESAGPENGDWNIQLFRSITSDSCVFDIRRQNLLFQKGGRRVQNDIMTSMVQQIRNARNFIFLENQYFLGSAYSWCQEQGTLTQHIVPQEITRKVVSKIQSGENFRVYALIPMFPEGNPADAAIQEILYWQYRTIETMYSTISEAIREAGSQSHPTDYLAFFCLGKRESVDEVPSDELEWPEAGSDPAIVRSTLRHPVYVHSKMTLVDDDYVIVGSANINQRSLGGNRDTEIAVGGYQPDHLAADGDPRGDVHTYRMALWAAHFGGFHEEFLNPASHECMAKVMEISRDFWDLYTADDPEHSDVHMLPYPITVRQEGVVEALEHPWDCFPDTQAPVLGKKSGYLPEKLTT